MAEATDETADEQGVVRFVNKRALYYWRLRQAFIAGEVDIDSDELARELMHLKMKTPKGRIQIIEKDIMKAALGKSPDDADDMMLAWSEDTAEGERDIMTVL